MFLFNAMFKIFGMLLLVFMIVFMLQRYYNAQSTNPNIPTPTINSSTQTAKLNSSEKEKYFNKIYNKTWLYIKNSDMKELNSEIFSKNQGKMMQLFKDKLSQKAPYKNKEKFVPVDPKYAKLDLKIGTKPSVMTLKNNTTPGKK